MEGLQVDTLKLYFGDNINIANGITLLQPTLGDIIEYGESKYFSMAQTICATPSSMKVALDDMDLDFAKITDFQLFMIVCQSLTQETTSILFGDLDLTQLKPYPIQDSDEVVLSNEDHTIVINEIIYEILVIYLRKMHGFKKQVDKPGNEITRKILIDVERKDAERNKNKPYKSFLVPLVSSLQSRNHWTKEYIRNMGIYEFFEQINRSQVIVQADAALTGSWSGMVDTKKIDKSVFDWMKDLSEDSKSNNQTLLNEGAN